MLLRGPVVLGCLTHSRRSGMDHTVLPAITPMPAFTSKAFTRWRLPRRRFRTSNCSLLLIYQPRKDARLSRSGWLTYSGRFTHISGHPSAAGPGKFAGEPLYAGQVLWSSSCVSVCVSVCPSVGRNTTHERVDECWQYVERYVDTRLLNNTMRLITGCLGPP